MEFTHRFRNYSEPAPAPKKWWRKQLRYWPLAVITGLVISHASVLLYLKSSVGAEQNRSELPIGEFAHQPKPQPQRHVQIRQIRLKAHVVLSTDSAPLAQRLLPKYQAKLRHEIERVLRQTDPLDLEDPSLDLVRGECKTAINNVLQRKLVKEVLFTGVSVDWTVDSPHRSLQKQ